MGSFEVKKVELSYRKIIEIEEKIFSLPVNSLFLSISYIFSRPYMFFLVDNNETKTEEHTIIIVPVEQEIKEEKEKLVYLGSYDVKIVGSSLHVFEIKK